MRRWGGEIEDFAGKTCQEIVLSQLSWKEL